MSEEYAPDRKPDVIMENGTQTWFVSVPQENEIYLAKASDGNWSGKMWKFGKIIEVRDIGPETVLQRLLTHE